MASIAKPVLLAVIGILAVVLFLQTSNLITGAVIGNETAPASITGQVRTQNTGPTTYDIACGTWTQAPTACVQDAAGPVCTISVHDNDGWLNVSSVKGWLNTGSGHCASTNKYSCFVNATCVNTSNVNLTDEVWTCSFDPMWFYANNGTWNVYINATDGIDTAESSTTKTRSDLDAIDVQTATINWGTLSVGSSDQQTNIAVNCGNIEQDINVNGTTMSCSIAGSIAAGNITTGISTGPTQQLSSSYYKLEADTAVATDEGTNQSQTTYWNLTVPSGASGLCTGTIHFVAIKNQTTT